MRTITLLLLMVLPPVAVAQSDPQPQAPAAEQPSKQERKPSAPELIADRLGLKFAVWSSKIRRRMISTRTPYGFAIGKVAAGSLADAAGLKRSTVVLEVNGKPFRQIHELADPLRQAKPGDAFILKCSRRRTAAERRGHRGRWIEFEVELKLPGQPEQSKPPAGKKKPKKKGILV